MNITVTITITIKTNNTVISQFECRVRTSYTAKVSGINLKQTEYAYISFIFNELETFGCHAIIFYAIIKEGTYRTCEKKY